MQLSSPTKGNLLISEPFLFDPNFSRTVVLLSEHNEEGSVGFIINRLLNMDTEELVPGLLNHRFPVFYGGPVEPNTLHFIHTCGQVIPGAQEITEGIYWGGDIDILSDLLNQKIVMPEECKFFVGYSGWTEGQLIEEIAAKAWWISDADAKTVFTDDLEDMWRRAVKNLGGDKSYLADAPLDPRWN